MLNGVITRAIRRYFVGQEQEFAFIASPNLVLPVINEADIYVHIPFCKNMCPYCPYNRIKYDQEMVRPFLQALLTEIDCYSKIVGKIRVSSVYIGGGTPTNLLEELGVIIDRIKSKFDLQGDICIETNPNDINRNCVHKLRDYGINMVSLGVQSFDDRYLRYLGRNYRADSIQPAIDLLLSVGFKAINLDLMFALGDQSVVDLVSDLDKAIASGVNQITNYPLFTFPYSTIGEYRKLKRIQMPPLVRRREMYRTTYYHCIENGFQPVSVWGFKRGETSRYSSVTRNHYIGFGPGAGSHVPGLYYLNTFSVPEYIQKCSKGRIPAAMKMEFNEKMERYYWLYWRFYDTFIPRESSNVIFANDKKFKQLIFLLRAFKLCNEDRAGYRLNERGAYWLHLMQNQFSLNYINSIWTAAKKEPWPDKIRF